MAMKPISIIGTGVSTASGNSAAELMTSLRSGTDALSPVETTHWPVPPKSGFQPLAFRWNRPPKTSVRDLLGKKLVQVFNEACESIGTETLKQSRSGLVLASTKGFTEDFVWSSESEKPEDFVRDSLTPLIEDFVAVTGVTPLRKICVSNACASSLAALNIAQTWLHSGRFDHVIVLACDAIDSFVLHGFHHLRVLSPDRTRPFSGQRSGFHLGDAAACVILSNTIQSDFLLVDARVDSEGHAATRPSHSGESLLRAANSLKTLNENPPELVIAHGTSTLANDVTEDRVFTSLFSSAKTKPLITATKWSVGHTLGAAGLVDVVVAVEVLKSQKTFSIFTTETKDSTFESTYLTRDREPEKTPETNIDRILITSLGFGGVHAAALVERK